MQPSQPRLSLGIKNAQIKCNYFVKKGLVPALILLKHSRIHNFGVGFDQILNHPCYWYERLLAVDVWLFQAYIIDPWRHLGVVRCLSYEPHENHG